jgi:hypothetical protein
MITKRSVARQLMTELKAAYAEIDAQPYEADSDRMAQAVGRYDGMKRAYVLLTGRSEQDVASEVVHWYIGTPEYRASKDRESAASSQRKD